MDIPEILEGDLPRCSITSQLGSSPVWLFQMGDAFHNGSICEFEAMTFTHLGAKRKMEYIGNLYKDED